jgi:hypothetical protein
MLCSALGTILISIFEEVEAAQANSCLKSSNASVFVGALKRSDEMEEAGYTWLAGKALDVGENR